MTVFGRLGSLFVVLGGVAFLLVDGLRSPPGLWYVAAGIAAGTTMVLYTVVSSPSPPRRPQPAPEPVPPGTSEESTTESGTQQIGSHPTETEHTAESTVSAEQEPEPAGDNDPNPPKPPISEEPEPLASEETDPTSTMAKKPRSPPADTETTQRTASYTEFSRTRKTTSMSTHRQRHVTNTASPRRNLSTETDNPYFKPVDSSRAIKFIQVDTRFSYLDVDWGPEFISLDPIPDLVEVDVGPSAVSHELVRSPIEIKISSFIKSLFMPPPGNASADARDETIQSVDVSDGRAHHQRDDTRARQRQVTRDTQETRHREQDWHVDRCRNLLTAADRRQQSAETWPPSSDREPVDGGRATADTAGYDNWSDSTAPSFGRFGDGRSPGWEPVMDEEPTEPQDVGIIDEPTVDAGLDRSPLRWEGDPFGLPDVAAGFSGVEEQVVEPVEQPGLGFGISDLEPDVPMEEPVMDPELGAERLGLDEFAEPPADGFSMPGVDVESGSNPLLPDAESFFPEEAEDDWLTF